MPAPDTIPCNSCEKPLDVKKDWLYRCDSGGENHLVCKDCLVRDCAVDPNEVEEELRNMGFWINDESERPQVGGPGA